MTTTSVSPELFVIPFLKAAEFIVIKVSLYLYTFLPPTSYNSFDQLEDFERPIVLLQSYLSVFERLICCL